VLYMLRGLGIDTGIDFDAVIDTGLWMADVLAKSPSRVGRAVAANRTH